MSEGYISMHVQFPSGQLAVLTGPNLQYWQGEGSPDFIGSLDEFRVAFPEAFQWLMDSGYIKAT